MSLTLERDLRAALAGEVDFDAAAKALYATDASNYRHVPIGVVCPKSEDDVARAIDICRRHGAPIVSRGAGTSLAGQTCNAAVVLDFSRHLNKILSIDPGAQTAVVQPGVILDHLRAAVEPYGLTFGPDPATHSRCTLGGMIGNNSCGVHALAWGKTVDNVERLEVLTFEGRRMSLGPLSPERLEALIKEDGPEGRLYRRLRDLRDRYADEIRRRFPVLPRRVSGYNLDQLLPENDFNLARALVGTEGTCVTVLQATLKLVPNPKARQLMVLGFDSVYDAADSVPGILAHQPIGLEGMDVDMVMPLLRYALYDKRIQRLPEGKAWLLVEFGGGSHEEVLAKAEALASAPLTPTPRSRRICLDPHETEDMWTIRESALAATAFIPGERDRLEGWEDTAVPPEKMGAYLRELRALYDRHGYRGAFYGHFGDGCLHTRINFDITTAEGRRTMRRFLDEAADLVARYGGSLSGEHGDGQARAELLPKMFGPEIVKAFEEFKGIWDPLDRMNPGKIVRSRGLLDDLRLQDNLPKPAVETHFAYAEDQHNFSRAMLRCVGVGKCRKEEGGVMCPSYQVTRDEKHSTRGRAHLLFEMLKGDVIRDGWASREVKEALDLCLSCKGCKTECPTNVDMASYKAEFLAHHYDAAGRPWATYFFGFSPTLLNAASRIPRLANALMRTPGLQALLNRLFGITPGRRFPELAEVPFRRRFQQQAPGLDKRTVLLWLDTFTNTLHPDIGLAAVRVLEHLGFHVRLPPAGLCCGRPLYDHGFLPTAKAWLRRSVDAMRSEIEAGIPLIGLEPGCLSVFRDELTGLFPDDPLARRLKDQTFLFSEFVLRHWPAPAAAASSASVPAPAVLHTHCHQKSILSPNADADLLKRMGFAPHIPETGCCGMAGAFGYEKSHQEVSTALAERALWPAVREAPATTAIVASGYSCREQIRLGTDRQAQHVAQVAAAHFGLQ